jgi:hypothetical protein
MFSLGRLKRQGVFELLLLALLLWLAPARAASPDAPWSGSGTGSTTVTSDGTVTDPKFDYSEPANSGAWTFSAVATAAHSVRINYHSIGFYSFFQVTAGLQRFVQRNGIDIEAKTLIAKGPVNCCDPPAGGFDYTGTTTFDNLQPGDVYGFRLTGSNLDGNPALGGSLTLQASVIFVDYSLDAPWNGSGTGTATVTSDGNATDPQFDYSASANSGAWTFSTVASNARSVLVSYRSTGFYSFFQVTAGLQQFVQRNGFDIAVQALVFEGPANCCDPPSGGFAYSGTATFASLQPGDIYGFRLTGSNNDGNQVLQGSLVLQASVIFADGFEDNASP